MSPAIATSSTLAATAPSLDLSWAITAVIAIAAFLSPIFVAIINNTHAKSMRKLEIEHTENLRKMELNQHITEKQFEVYYADKKAAFDEFIKNAGLYTAHRQSLSSYEVLLSSTSRAMLFCNASTQTLLYNFIDRVDNEFFGGNCSKSERIAYTSLLCHIATLLNEELSSTKPLVDCK